MEGTLIGDQGYNLKETPQSEKYSKYLMYKELEKIQFSHDEILSQLGVADQEMMAILDEFDIDNTEDETE